MRAVMLFLFTNASRLRMPFLRERMKEKREALRLSQTDLAKMIGSTQQQISRYEVDREPVASVLKKIADVLGCTTDYLVGSVNEAEDRFIMSYRRGDRNTAGDIFLKNLDDKLKESGSPPFPIEPDKG
jgi:transcriptional regulator with XRE-family HTH domain